MDSSGTPAVSLSPADRNALTTSTVVTNNYDGTFTASFTGKIAGWYSVYVYLARQNIAGSPYRQQISAGSISAQYTRAYGPGFVDLTNYIYAQARANAVLSMIIQAADQYGNQLTRGGDTGLMYFQYLQVKRCSLELTLFTSAQR